MKYILRKKIVASHQLTNLLYLLSCIRSVVTFSFLLVVGICLTVIPLHFTSVVRETNDFWHTGLGTSYLLVGVQVVFLIYFIFVNKIRIKLGKIRREKLKPIIILCLLIPLAEVSPNLIGIELLGAKDDTESIESHVMLIVLTTCLFAPIVEEFIFRGTIERILLKLKTSPWVAIIASSFMFSVAHCDKYQSLSVLGAGILYGWVYYKTRSLMPSLILHISWNTLVCTLQLLEKTKYGEIVISYLYKEPTSTHSIMFASISLLILILFVFLLCREIKNCNCAAY